MKKVDLKGVSGGLSTNISVEREFGANDLTVTLGNLNAGEINYTDNSIHKSLVGVETRIIHKDIKSDSSLKFR